MIRAVLDTNTIISGLLWVGAPAQAIDAALDDRYVLLSTPVLIAELRRVLNRPKFVKQLALIQKTADNLLEHYEHLVEMVEPAPVEPAIKDDPTDDHILACAVGGKATHIVSGDRHLTKLQSYEQIPIISVNEFVALLSDEM